MQGLCLAEFCSTSGCQIYDSTNCGCPSDCPNWPQAIFLNSGWNLISFDIVPNDNSIENVFANLIAADNLEFVTGYENETKTYDPNGPLFLNTIAQMENGFGYWVKVTNAAD